MKNTVNKNHFECVKNTSQLQKGSSLYSKEFSFSVLGKQKQIQCQLSSIMEKLRLNWKLKNKMINNHAL